MSTTLGTSLVITWPGKSIELERRDQLERSLADLFGENVSLAWHESRASAQPSVPWGHLPADATAGQEDLAATCPVCQAEFKVGAPAL